MLTIHTPASRRNDMESNHAAADEITLSSVRQKQIERVIAMETV